MNNNNNKNNYGMNLYQEYIHKSRYARFLEDEGRRENWDETVARYFDFFEEHLKENNNFDLKPYRKELEDAVLNLRVMPSMRALMTAGPALKRENVAGFNCSFAAINRMQAFDEILYVLMNGTGVGFSVETDYVEQLPRVAESFHDTDTTIQVADSKMGWARSLRELIGMLYVGQIPKWDTSKVRPAGALLKTFGGRASGPEPLEDLFRFCVSTFQKAAGRRLTSLECHDIVCKIGEAVVVGGVRRSATISLSDLSDDRLRTAKSGQWWLEHPERSLANNSAVYKEKPEIGLFMQEWLSLYESKSGERGIFNRHAAVETMKKTGRRDSDHIFGTNPCGEILLRDREFCNLTEKVIRETETMEDLERDIVLATILGTIQSTLTNFKYLSSAWKKNCEEERLLGVSLTGIMCNELTNGRKAGLEDRLSRLRDIAIETNKKWASMLGVNPSVAVTCVKPSGCATLDTKIKTTDGIKSFAEIFFENAVDLYDFEAGKWITPKKDIFVFDENNNIQKITNLYVNGIKEVYELEDELGNKYKFTEEHKVKTKRGWIEVKNLTLEDEIIQFS